MPSSLLYCSETWTTYARNIKRLNSFHMRCLRKWQDKIPDTEVLKRSGLTYLGTMITQKRLRWLGHVKWMDDSHTPKTILFSEACDGSRKQGRPLLRYHDNCKSNMKSFDMCATQRSSWREKVTMGARRYEQAFIQRMEQSRKRGKQPLINLDANGDAFICEHCNKRCRSRIGLFSHIRIHIIRLISA